MPRTEHSTESLCCCTIYACDRMLLFNVYKVKQKAAFRPFIFSFFLWDWIGHTVEYDVELFKNYTRNESFHYV